MPLHLSAQRILRKKDSLMGSGDGIWWYHWTGRELIVKLKDFKNSKFYATIKRKYCCCAKKLFCEKHERQMSRQYRNSKPNPGYKFGTGEGSQPAAKSRETCLVFQNLNPLTISGHPCSRLRRAEDHFSNANCECSTDQC